MRNKKLLLSLFVIILLPYFLVSFYCHPAADDFEYAASSLRKGYWFSYFRDYQVWNGRFTSNLFVFASPLILHSFTIYKLIPLILIILTYVSLLYFIRTITGNKVAGVALHLYTLIIVSLYLCNAPSFVETFYWYTGAITYQLATVLMVIYFALFFRFINHDYFYNRVIHRCILLILIPIICGFNEVIMLMMLSFCFLFLIKWIQLKRKHYGVVILFLCFALASAAFMILAPGNKGRASNFSDNHQLFYSLYMTALQVIRFMFKWIVQVQFIIATILFIPISKYLMKVSPFFKNKFYVSPLITFSSLFGIIFLCVFPAYWSMGMLGQHRTLNVAYFFFILLWFLNVHLAVHYFSSKKLPIIRSNRSKGILVVLLIVGLVFTNNGYTVFADLVSGRARTYNDEMNVRYAKINSSAKSHAKEAIVENLSAKPVSLRIYDITCDSENWINKSYSDYFDIERVRLKACD